MIDWLIDWLADWLYLGEPVEPGIGRDGDCNARDSRYSEHLVVTLTVQQVS